ncbi:MAG: hypothetical protein AAF447_20270, partial [Myxococcota bacterium]
MTATPSRTAGPGTLSHHALLELVAPFSQRGYRVDLPACDRKRGTVVFRTRERPAPEGLPALRSQLRLERPHRLKFKLIRTLEGDGRSATMTAVGDVPEALLDAVEAMPLARQFHLTAQGLVTRSYYAEAWRKGGSGPSRWPRRPCWPRLVGADARLGPVGLAASDTEGREVNVELHAERALELTADFLSVLGWGWRPLRPAHTGRWKGSLRPSGPAAKRSERLEAELDRAVAHLAATLSTPPSDFHRTHRGARWRAAAQRLLPLLTLLVTFVAFVTAVLFVPKTPAMHMVMQLASFLAIGVVYLSMRHYRL